MQTELASVAIALLSLLGVIFTSWMVARTKSDTTLINKSVNHVLPDERGLYRLVVEVNERLADISKDLHDVEAKLDAHVLVTSIFPAAYTAAKIVEKIS